MFWFAPVGLADPELPVLVGAPLEPLLPDCEAPVGALFEPETEPDGADVALSASANSAEDALVTQLEDAAALGVYGTLVMGPKDSGG